MILTNYYYYFSKALSPKLCKDIIEHGLSQKEQKGLVGGTDTDYNKNIRDSDVVWFDDPWIYKEIVPFIQEANKLAGWNFKWDLTETFQFTKYKLNQFYDWHADGWDKPYDAPGTKQHQKIRKLSVTCQLNDKSEYTGGELEFDFKDYAPNKRKKKIHEVVCKEIGPVGSIVVFPSFVWHRVKPVTSGTRYSLVMWNLGNVFDA